MPIRYHRPTGYECPTSVLNHHNSMSSNGKLCSRAVAKSRPAKPIGPKPPPPSPSPQPKPTPVPPTPVPPTPPTPTPTPTPTPKRSSSALLVSCWAQSSTAAQVRPGAPSAQILDLFAAHPPDENKACAKEAASPVAPRSGRFFSAGGQEVHSKRIEAVRKGMGEGANGPAEHTCNASGHCTGLWDNTMVYGHGSRRVVGTSPQLTCCGGIRACGCSSCRLRARCCCHRGCGRQERGREPILSAATDEPRLAGSGQKSCGSLFLAAIFISAFRWVLSHLRVQSAVWDAD